MDWLVRPLAVLVPLWVLAALLLRLYWVLWTYVGLSDVLRLLGTALAVFGVGAGILWGWGPLPPPAWFLSAFLSTAGLAAMVRLVHRQGSLKAESLDQARGRILVVGAGEAGRQILADLRDMGEQRKVLGILDDDASKHGMTLSGVKVLGPLGEVRAWVDRLGVEDVIIAVGALSGESLSRILDALDLRKTRVRIIPSPGESLLERMTVDRTREIRAEDLLGRKGVELDEALMKECLRGKTVFITGAGGSIGSEICHQLLSYPLAGLVCLSRSEYSLYRLQEKLAGENKAGIPIAWYLGDVRDADRMLEIARRHRPNFFFHAAAHKHVPYMETHEKEAFKNNVLGTESVLLAARDCGAERFILVSTDKAVRPTNVMGASKRLAEMLVTSFGAANGMHTALVRFGNVLGSRGSVVPLFRRQILKGGPITVTHPDVVRFFMTVTEAALLVIGCAALSKGGERFILDMGEPVRIDDLVRRMIRLYRYEPDRDIPIAYTGLRPGEKLYEELLTSTEGKTQTAHPKIFVLHDEQAPPEGYAAWLTRMKAELPGMDGDGLRREMLRMIPDFKPLGPDGKPYEPKSPEA